MGFKDMFKTIKPNKEKLALLQKQLDEGRVLRVNDGFDNVQMMNEADLDAEE